MGGGSPQQPTQSTTTNLSPQAEQLFNLALPNIQSYAAGPPPARYPDSTVAPFNANQTTAQDVAYNNAATQGDLADFGVNTLASVVSNQERGLPTGITAMPGAFDARGYAKPGEWVAPGRTAQSSNIFSDPGIWNPAANPGLQQAITAATRPTWEALTEQALPAIRSQAISTGPYGGSRQGVAEGVAVGKATTAAGDIARRMANDQYAANLAAVNSRYGMNLGASTTERGQDVTGSTTARGQDVTARGQDITGDLTARGQDITGRGQELDYLGRQYGQNQAATYQALGLIPQMQQSIMAPAQTISAVGDAQQQMAQAQLNDQVAAWNYNQTAPYNQARDIMGLLSAMPGATTTSTANVPQANPMMQSLGGAASGAALGSAIMPGVGTLAGAGAGALLPFLFK